MRLQRKGAPDAADAALAEPGGLGEGARGPVRGSLRLAFQGAGQYAFDGGLAQAARRARTGFIEQSVQAEKDKRCRHLQTVAPVTRTRRATSMLLSLSAHSRTMRARQARACAVFRRRDHSNRCRSAGTRVKGESGRPRAMLFLPLISDAGRTAICA